MGRKVPPIKMLLVLEAVVRRGGTTAAAAELGVTHGAISKQIAALEEWLGRSLFDRERGRFRPYDEAIALASLVTEYMDRIGVAIADITTSRRQLRVLAHASFAMHWLVPRLSVFYAQHPYIELHVQTRQTREELGSVAFDVAVTRGGETVKEWLAIPVMVETITLLASPAVASRLAAGGVAALADEAIVVSDTRPGEMDSWLTATGLPLRHERWTWRRFGHFHTVIQAALTGQGVMAGPTEILADKIRAGVLVAPFPGITITGPRHIAFINPDAPNFPAAECFANWLALTAKASSADDGDEKE
jgi:LysR family transcriptional regulator, glycine cleavage system transcriptional activator